MPSTLTAFTIRLYSTPRDSAKCPCNVLLLSVIAVRLLLIMWSKNFDKRPHRRVVTRSDDKGIRPTLTPYNTISWAHLLIQPPKRHLDRFSRFAWLTNMTNRQTDRPTDRSRYSVCSNRPLLLANAAMQPSNNNNYRYFSGFVQNSPIDVRYCIVS